MYNIENFEAISSLLSVRRTNIFNSKTSKPISYRCFVAPIWVYSHEVELSYLRIYVHKNFKPILSRIYGVNVVYLVLSLRSTEQDYCYMVTKRTKWLRSVFWVTIQSIENVSCFYIKNVLFSILIGAINGTNQVCQKVNNSILSECPSDIFIISELKSF